MAETIDLVRVVDARSAMCALIESRGIAMREDDPEFPKAVAALAWLVADAMQAERKKRGGR